MRFLLTGSLAAISILLTTMGADSQPLPPKGRSPIATPLEMLEWEASLAENGYNSQKTDKHLTNLISVYERMVALACMPQLQKTLSHKGLPTDPTCLKYMELTLKIDSENPVALCARDGIDSKSCEAAYDAQDLGEYSKDTAIWPAEDSPETQLELNLESAREEQANTSTLESELYRLENSPLNDPKERESRESKVLQIYNKLIKQSCTKPKLKIISLRGESTESIAPEILELLKDSSLREQAGSSPPAERLKSLQQIATAYAANSSIAPQDPSSPMDQVIKALSVTKDPGSGKIIRIRQDGMLRWRLITLPCKEAIKRARSRGRAPAEAACAEQGDSSPACIRVRRTERALEERARASIAKPAPGGQKPTGTPANNFSTF